MLGAPQHTPGRQGLGADPFEHSIHHVEIVVLINAAFGEALGELTVLLDAEQNVAVLIFVATKVFSRRDGRPDQPSALMQHAASPHRITDHHASARLSNGIDLLFEAGVLIR